MFSWLKNFKSSPIPGNVIMNQSNKILILGARGNLGSRMRDVLANTYRLLLWGKDEVDASNFQALRKKIKEHRPNVIVNCIAYNAVDNCETDEGCRLATRLNAELPAELADIALELDCILVHFSTDYVFGGDQKDGYAEDSPTAPISKYGKSKEQGEKEIIARESKGLKYYLIRTSKLFGPRGDSENAKESFFDLILRLSKTQDEFKMIDGEEISCFTYTKDLSQAAKELIESGKERGVYHIVNEGAASWYDGAKYLFELKGIAGKKLIPVVSSSLPRPARRPQYSVLLNTKLKELRTWQQALAEYLNKD